MRKDMHKVLVEKPRHGHGAPNQKTGGRVTADSDGPLNPQRAPMRLRNKTLSDHLNPLRRYLRTQVGRPWNKVYAEINASLPSGMHGHHLRSHPRNDVIQDCFEKDGVVYGRKLYSPEREIGGGELFVHPRTGILRIGKYKKVAQAAPKPVCEIALGPGKQLRQIDGIWYYLEFREYYVEKTAMPGVLRRVRMREITIKRQLNKRELAAHSLHNKR